jgi:hypothetical protein
MIVFIGTSLQSKPIITAHDQWLPKTRSILYRSTSVFSSALKNDERKISWDWIIELPYDCRMFEFSWTELSSRWPEYRSPSRRLGVIFFPLPRNVLTEPLLSNGLFHLVTETCVSGPLASNGLFHLLGVMSHYWNPIIENDSWLSIHFLA